MRIKLTQAAWAAAYVLGVVVVSWLLVAGWDRWNEQYRLGNGDSLWIVCGSLEDADGRLTFSPGLELGTGTVRCTVNRR